jgi:hypothetical protein
MRGSRLHADSSQDKVRHFQAAATEVPHLGVLNAGRSASAIIKRRPVEHRGKVEARRRLRCSGRRGPFSPRWHPASRDSFLRTSPGSPCAHPPNLRPPMGWRGGSLTLRSRRPVQSTAGQREVRKQPQTPRRPKGWTSPVSRRNVDPPQSDPRLRLIFTWGCATANRNEDMLVGAGSASAWRLAHLLVIRPRAGELRRRNG